MDEYKQFLIYISTLQHPTYEYNGIHYQWPLEGMQRLDEYLGSPSKNLKVIHIAGTNGKGSCSSFIASSLMSLGLKVGTYNSPQLFDIRERIKINGKMISHDDVCTFFHKIIHYSDKDRIINNESVGIVSYSEVFVAMAFDFFVRKSVDIAVIETGIGGRLDPTNIVIEPLICVITSIGKDHTELFGDSIANITMEKCGIIKKHCPVVVGHVTDEVKQIINTEATYKHSETFFIDEYYSQIPDFLKFSHDRYFDLQGKYQTFNIQIALCVIDILSKLHPDIISNIVPKRILHALRNTSHIMDLHGRWEIIRKSPMIIADICSNPLGLELNIKQLLHMLASDEYNRLVLILGLTSIRKIAIKEFLPRDAWYIYTASKSFICADELAKDIGIKGDITNSVQEAITLYLKNSRKDDIVYIGGSIHVVADALIYLRNRLKVKDSQ